MAFNVKDISSNFKSLEHFKGSDYTYFVAAKQDEAKLGLCFEPAAFVVPYKGKKTAVRGLVMRGIMVGEHGFKSLHDRGETYRQYRAEDGEKIKGVALFRHLIPLTTETSSAKEFHDFAEAAFSKLYDWLQDRVAAEGGDMVVSKEEFQIECSNVLVNIEVTVPDLFHLPGEVPSWVEAPKPTKAEKPADPHKGKDDNDASQDDNDED